jgi:hypothetical protein
MYQSVPGIRPGTPLLVYGHHDRDLVQGTKNELHKFAGDLWLIRGHVCEKRGSSNGHERGSDPSTSCLSLILCSVRSSNRFSVAA